MAYSTGTAASLTDLFNQLVTFMTANGWTLHDSVSSTDKVLKSNGLDGKLDMYYRLTTSDDTNYPYKNAACAYKVFKYLTVRGYANWNATTHVGIGEYGYALPTITFNKNNNVGYTIRAEDGPFPLPATIMQWPVNGPMCIWDGRRKFLWSSTDFNSVTPWHTDHRGNRQPFSWMGINQHYNVNQPALVHDYANDKDWLYFVPSTTTLADQFWRYDVENASWAKMPQPSWANNGSGSSASACVSDGGDYIYAMRAGNTTHFAKYQISTNTWSNLADLPINGRQDSVDMGAGNMAGSRMYYASAAMTGLSEDVIYAICEYNPYNGAANKYYRYDVTSNTWRDVGSGGMALQTGFSAWINGDHQKYIYVGSQNNLTNIYRGDITSQPNPSFIDIGSHDTLGSGSWRSCQITRTLIGKVRAHNSLVNKYYFIGDADGVTVVSRIFTSGSFSHNYWMQIGKIATSYQSDIMTTTGSVSAGPRQTISVDSSANYYAGQNVQLYDPSTGTTELINIYDVPNGTSIRASVMNSYTTGSRIGADPCQYGIYSDHGLASMPNTVKGYRVDKESDWYWCEPSETRDRLLTRTPSIRNQYMPCPMEVFNHHSISKKEARGTLRNIYAIGKIAYPGPVDESIIKVKNKNYLAFNTTEADRITDSQYMVVVGPIN